MIGDEDLEKRDHQYEHVEDASKGGGEEEEEEEEEEKKSGETRTRGESSSTPPVLPEIDTGHGECWMPKELETRSIEITGAAGNAETAT